MPILTGQMISIHSFYNDNGSVVFPVDAVAKIKHGLKDQIGQFLGGKMSVVLYQHFQPVDTKLFILFRFSFNNAVAI